ncbi:MAG: DUF4476 domain-containing protein [Bacteroidota bacterium]|nr:DUF4476 domain-containing protein [Bacteroidota bacterium]
MLIFMYKKLFFLFLIIAFAFSASAQQDHFVYLQTDNGKPFYVKMDQKILSSSPEGYIIIPNIVNGVYQLKIGFPKKEYPEESFTLSVDNENEGYLIKHFEDKGLQLFNMETLALVSGKRDSSTKAVVNTKKEANPFTQMLANVVKDSTILQNHEEVVENPSKMADTSKLVEEVASSVGSTPADTTSSALNNVASSSVTEPADTPAKRTGAVSPSISSSASSDVGAGSSPVSKLLSTKDSEGLQMVYADNNGNETDTVRVFIPAAQELPNTSSGKTKNENFDFSANKNPGNSSVDTSQLTITPTIVKPEDKKAGFVLRKDTISMSNDSSNVTKTAPEQVFYIGPQEKDEEKNIETSENKTSNEKKGLFSGINLSKSSKKEPSETDNPRAKIELLPKVVTSSKVNSDCKSFADNEDFLRLRKKMASESSKEGMIKVAEKYFRSKCYSTEQIKDLSYLFLTDEGKYMFFDAAYAHTSDSDQYSELESQLKDPYYQNRFKAMIRK